MIVTSDSFLGTSGTNLLFHTGEFGATWTKQVASPGDLLLTDANRLRGETANTESNYYSSGQPSSAEYDVSADFVVQTIVANQYTALYGRMVPGVNTSLYLTYLHDRFFLGKIVAGVGTDLTNVINGLSAGNTYRARLVIRNDFVDAYCDSTHLFTFATPNDVTLAGRGGVGFYADGAAPATTNSTGIHLDNFKVQEIDPLPNTGRYVRQALKRASFF